MNSPRSSNGYILNRGRNVLNDKQGKAIHTLKLENPLVPLLPQPIKCSQRHAHWHPLLLIIRLQLYHFVQIEVEVVYCSQNLVYFSEVLVQCPFHSCFYCCRWFAIHQLCLKVTPYKQLDQCEKLANSDF